MRKLNAILTVLILVTFLVHAIFASFQLIGVGSRSMKIMARAALTLVAAHTVIGVITTVKTLIATKRSGAPYFKHNLLFWARRISGFAVMILLAFHFIIFGTGVKDRLPEFDVFSLITQIALVVTIAVHVVSNAKPVLISFGIKSLKPYAGDILFYVSIASLLFIAAFIVYYIRWYAVA